MPSPTMCNRLGDLSTTPRLSTRLTYPLALYLTPKKNSIGKKMVKNVVAAIVQLHRIFSAERDILPKTAVQ